MALNQSHYLQIIIYFSVLWVTTQRYNNNNTGWITVTTLYTACETSCDIIIT